MAAEGAQAPLYDDGQKNIKTTSFPRPETAKANLQFLSLHPFVRRTVKDKLRV